jgi:4,5-DOPA dioxygenase extradiol
MKLAFPEADVPIVQLSLRSGLDIATHMKIGEALAPLREEGVLIIGSGQTTHNLGEFGAPGRPEKWAMDFTEWVRRTLEDVGGTDLSAARQSMLNIMREAPNAARCHPRIEHLVPLHVAFAAGAAPPSTQCSADAFSAKRIYSQMVLGTMSLDSYEFN